MEAKEKDFTVRVAAAGGLTGTIVLVIVLIVLVLSRGLFVPKSWGQYGWYRGDAVEEHREKPVVHGGDQSCRECHEDQYDLREEGGHVERALFKVAATFERETDSAIKIMLSLLEPVLILVLGVIVGFIVISMLLPIFEINFLAR